MEFTGKERDVETGFDYFGFRYFSSAQGRWTTPDEPFADEHPEDPQTWNLYTYGSNNPLRFVDTDGRGIWDKLKGAYNAFLADNSYGIGRNDNGNADYRQGQAFGDAAAGVTGTAEALFGGGEAAATSLAAVTVIGTVIPAAGVAVAAHGTTTAIIAGGHLVVAAFADNGNSQSGEMLGASGTQVSSQTVGKLEGGVRVDVENPNPGQRPGQIQVQRGSGSGKETLLYNPSTGEVTRPEGIRPSDANRLSNSDIRRILKSNDFQKAISKAKKILGVQ